MIHFFFMKQKALKVSKTMTNFQKNKQDAWEDRVVGKTGRAGFKHRCLKMYFFDHSIL